MPIINRGDDHFQAGIYTGNGSSVTITGLRFQPDFVWIKGRSGATDHALYDAVRGAEKRLESNQTDAEVATDSGVTAFTSDGFTVGSLAQVNTNAATYAYWAWKANGAGSSNTAGSISSTVSANTTAGFSIVTYTGTGANATVGHGLGVAPKMIIVKSRDQGTTGYTGNWYVYHASNTAAPETDYLLLNTTAATADDTFWNDTAPTSTVFSVGALSGTNDSSDKFVTYCFAEVPGYSAFGSYTGNGSTDGPFVYTGFRPRYLLVKRTDTAGNWVIHDTARDLTNVADKALYPNLSTSEGTGTRFVDILSNGFKVRGTDTDHNANTGTYIYAAFAETAFKFSLGR